MAPSVRYLSDGRSIALTPRFSPTRQEITYMSYESGQPQVYLLQIETGQRELVGNFPGMTFAPRFSPDGQKVIMSLLRDDGNSNIFAHGSEQPHHDAADQFQRHRHLAILFARRQPGRVHLRPRRPRADLRHGRRRLRPDTASPSATAPIRRRYGRRAAI